MLQEIMQLYQLTQIIDDPTRVTKSTKSILDVCITSSPDKNIQSGVVHLGISYHSLIYATRKLNSVILKEILKIRLNLETLGNLMLKAFLVTCICFHWQSLTANKTWMKCGNAGKPYFFKCLTEEIKKIKEKG
jgi:hypothetical protein